MQRHRATVPSPWRIVLAACGLLTGCGALLMLIALLWMLSGAPPGLAQACAGVLCVATTGSDTPGCGSDTTPCRTIQYAVDQAQVGQEIRVAAGVHTGVQVRAGIAQMVYVSKTVTLRGGYTTTNWTTSDPLANPTTLDAQGLGRVLVITGTITPTVESLRITGGDATGLGGGPDGWDAGGGAYVYGAAATISGCAVYNNIASTVYPGFGGGLYLSFSDATLWGNTVQDNTGSTTSAGRGGGLYLLYSPAALEGNAVLSNTGTTWGVGHGGGMYLERSDATVQDNRLQGNTASTGGHGYGGGLYAYICSPMIRSNTVAGNIASTAGWGSGGGLELELTRAIVDGNTVQGNTASTTDTGHGGGLNLWSSPATLVGNTVVSNTASMASFGYGGGLCLRRSAATLERNTVVSNTASLTLTATGLGGGLYVEESSPLALTNDVVAGNHAATEGSGLWVARTFSGQLLHATLAGNHGSGQGVYVGENTTLDATNTILAGHASVGITVTAGSTARLEGTLWHDNGTDTGGGGTVASTVNVYGDPAFVGGGDYHLGSGSAAIDAGVDAGITVDIDGDLRPIGTGYDIGADEYGSPTEYLPVVLMDD